MMTVSHELLNAVAQLSAERMVDSLVIGSALAMFAWTLLRVLPRQDSATRFALWFAALIATAVLPFCNSAPSASTLMQTVTSAARPLISIPGSWALYLFAAWALFAMLALARIAVGFLELSRLRRQCRPIDVGGHGWREMVARACPARRVRILSCDRIPVPTAIGFFRPAVVIPAAMLSELTPSELQQVLLHELAHLRRWDDWTNLVQRFLKAILFFHPAVWWMEERISLEREMACDDAVLAETASPRAYAECLATLAEKSFVRRSAALAQAAVNRIRQTTLRVAQILDVNRSKSAPARKSAVALTTAFACACGIIAWRAPQLVGFDDSPPVIAGAVRTAATHQQPVLAAAAAKQRRPEPKVMMARSADVAETQSSPRRRKSEVPRLGFPALEKTRGSPPSLGMTSLSVVVGHEGRAAQVIQARASAENQPRFRTGVVVIFVNHPVFGPTPIFWHYAVWQVAPQRHTNQGTPQKVT